MERNPADAVEGTNELIGTSDSDAKIDYVVAWEVAMAKDVERRSAALGRKITMVLLNVAIGDPQHGAQTARLVPEARAAVEGGHALGYHAYFPTCPDLERK